MPAIIVIGAQWGDEGKGRVVDNLASQAHMVTRFNGGDNAGHTVIAEGQTLRLHLVPSGILHRQTTCLIGGGVVVNLARLIQELDELAASGVEVGPERVKLATTTHLILPSHRALDGARESSRGEEALGTTKRGIGPTYADKASRIGLRAGDMEDPERFAERVAETVRAHNRILQEQYGQDPLLADEVAGEHCAYAQRLRPHLANGPELVDETLTAGQTLLCEGAQGTLLDLDHGTYPYVTSSSTIAGGALTGLGFGPRYVERVVGVAKAYTTRVGAGPFPTELLDSVGERMREIGGEFGTTTGRPRRCGWLDLTILRYTARLNGLTELALTKLDVLTGIHPLRIAEAYQSDEGQTGHFPTHLGALGLTQWKPVYKDLPGWDQEIQDARSLDDLSQEAQAYVSYIQKQVGVPITLVGVGPERDQAVNLL
jgi:adenylosuccinate synthase